MKMRTVKFSPEFLIEKLQGKPLTTALNLPSDAELLGIRFDVFSNQVVAVIRSDTFEDIQEGCPIPELTTSTATTSKGAVQQSLMQKPENKPTPAKIQVQAPITASRVQVQAKRSTSLMEEEFSAEQRKLLNFSVDGDFLIVKPAKFLKAEWEDINEVARSLGGRWVKGDIISYWEIPMPKK